MERRDPSATSTQEPEVLAPPDGADAADEASRRVWRTVVRRHGRMITDDKREMDRTEDDVNAVEARVVIEWEGDGVGEGGGTERQEGEVAVGEGSSATTSAMGDASERVGKEWEVVGAIRIHEVRWALAQQCEGARQLALWRWTASGEGPERWPLSAPGGAAAAEKCIAGCVWPVRSGAALEDEDASDVDTEEQLGCAVVTESHHLLLCCGAYGLTGATLQWRRCWRVPLGTELPTALPNGDAQLATHTRKTRSGRRPMHGADGREVDVAPVAAAAKRVDRWVLMGCTGTPYCVVLEQPVWRRHGNRHDDEDALWERHASTVQSGPSKRRRRRRQETAQTPAPPVPADHDMRLSVWDVRYARRHWMAGVHATEMTLNGAVHRIPVPTALPGTAAAVYEPHAHHLQVRWRGEVHAGPLARQRHSVEISEPVTLPQELTLRDMVAQEVQRARSGANDIDRMANGHGDDENASKRTGARLRDHGHTRPPSGGDAERRAATNLAAALAVVEQSGSTAAWGKAWRGANASTDAASQASDRDWPTILQGWERQMRAAIAEDTRHRRRADDGSTSAIHNVCKSLSRQRIDYAVLMPAFRDARSLAEVSDRVPYLPLGYLMAAAPAEEMIGVLVRVVRRQAARSSADADTAAATALAIVADSVYAYAFISHADLVEALRSVSLRDACRILRDVAVRLRAVSDGSASPTDPAALSGAMHLAALLLDTHLPSLLLTELPVVMQLHEAAQRLGQCLGDTARLRGVLDQWMAYHAPTKASMRHRPAVCRR